MTVFRISEQTQRLVINQPFVLESGETLPMLEIAYRTWGTLSTTKNNAIIVCHALTGSADADVWWANLFGEGKALDPKRHFIVCSNVLGGCYGTTGATHLHPNGQIWGARFPSITLRDQVRVQMLLADQLGIRSIKCVVGGSMGGLQALEWALLDPRRVESVISIAATGRHSAWCMAWSEAQRLALTADAKFQGGNYSPDTPPVDGLKAARAIAMIAYRSSVSFEKRFGRGIEKAKPPTAANHDFAIRHWLRFHGDELAKRFDANSYLTLIKAMDTHDLSRGRGNYAQVLQRIQQPVLIGSVVTDTLYVPDEQYQLALALPNAELFEIHSEHGHDGFLINASDFEPDIRRFIHPTFAIPQGTVNTYANCYPTSRY